MGSGARLDGLHSLFKQKHDLPPIFDREDYSAQLSIVAFCLVYY